MKRDNISKQAGGYRLSRIDREKRTVGEMIAIYCRSRHGSGVALCPECSSLADYVDIRLDRCPYSFQKPACADCPIHCYQAGKRAMIKDVMRYSGPRMLYRHPILALFHKIDGAFGRCRTTPERRKKGAEKERMYE